MTEPFFSIITPTLQRESLITCCNSVRAQSFDSWEMLIQCDSQKGDMGLWDRIPLSEGIYLHVCGMRHHNFGNTCRHLAWKWASGKYVIHLDDDNFLADTASMQRIHDALSGSSFPKVGIFPIVRHGWYFFNDPPGLCRTDTANFVLERSIAQWPDRPEYTLDGIFIEQLVAEHGYVAFPNVPPIINVPVSSRGE